MPEAREQNRVTARSRMPLFGLCVNTIKTKDNLDFVANHWLFAHKLVKGYLFNNNNQLVPNEALFTS